MKTYHLITNIIFLVNFGLFNAEVGVGRGESCKRSVISVDTLLFLFYNTENFYDTLDEPGTRDAEFLPEGIRQWTGKRYWRKVWNLYRAIKTATPKYPDLIGLCEVENSMVLEDLFLKTPLKHKDYQFVHFDLEDERGIDLALAFKTSVFSLKEAGLIKTGTCGMGRSLRSIMKATLEHPALGMLEVYLNHWPSNYGGDPVREEERRCIAALLASDVNNTGRERVVIMGDFNAVPSSPGMRSLVITAGMENPYTKVKMGGSIFYDGKWLQYDQILYKGFENVPLDWGVLNDSLLTDRQGRPWRTYRGNYYSGGFSDHFPVFLRFYIASPNLQ